MPAIGSSSSSRRGLAGQRHGDLELALLAVAERRRRHVRARVEADRLRGRAGRLAQAPVVARVGEEAEGMAGMGLHGERHIVDGALNSRSTEVIWNERAEPQPHPRMDRQTGDVAAGEVDGAGVGPRGCR